MLKLTYFLWIIMLFCVSSCKQTVHLYPITKDLEKVDTVYLSTAYIDLSLAFTALDSQSYQPNELEGYQNLIENKIRSNFKKSIKGKFAFNEIEAISKSSFSSSKLCSIKGALDSVFISQICNCKPFDEQDSIFFVDYRKVIGLNEIEFKCINDSFAQIDVDKLSSKNELDSFKISSYRYYWLNFVDSELYTKRKRFWSKLGDIVVGVLTGVLLGPANTGSGSSELEKVKLYSAIYDATKREIIYFNFLQTELYLYFFYPHPEKRRAWRPFIRTIKKDLPEDVFVVVPKGI